MAGRRSLLTKDEHGNFDPKVEAFFQCIENGMSNKMACSFAEISDAIIYEYMQKGREDKEKGIDSAYVEFLDRTTHARAKCQLWHLQNIRKASVKDGKYSTWFLEHVFHDEFCNYEKNDEKVESIEIKWVDAKEQQERIKKLEEEVKENLKK